MPSQRGNTKRAIATFTIKKAIAQRGINRKLRIAKASQIKILANATTLIPCTHALPDSMGRSGDIQTKPSQVSPANRPHAIASVRNCIYFHSVKLISKVRDCYYYFIFSSFAPQNHYLLLNSGRNPLTTQLLDPLLSRVWISV